MIQVPNGSIAIAQISDLHFGNDGQPDAWRALSHALLSAIQPRPQLVLVTGDIVDTPDVALYNKAKDALDHLRIPYRVCAGNHDRHTKGNMLSLWRPKMASVATQFDHVFAGQLVTTSPTTITLGSTKLGLAAIDTSRKADAFARGLVEPADLDELQGNWLLDSERPNWQFFFLLVHHHPLSVARLEASRIGDRKRLFDVTSLANSGTLLERAAELSVDVILHGHEHCRHWARYGSVQPPASDLSVLGAGTATGARTLKSCLQSEATFNLIILHRSSAIEAWVVRHNGIAWGVEDKAELSTIRGSRARQRARNRPATTSSAGAGLLGKLQKHVAFEDNRDVHVRSVYRNLVFSDTRRRIEMRNGSGVVPGASVRVIGADGVCGEGLQELDVVRETNAADTWVAHFDLSAAHVNVPITMELMYTWRGGAVLDQYDLHLLHGSGGYAGGATEERAEGFEYVYVTATSASEASLYLSLPPQHAPDPEDIEILVRRVSKERLIADPEETARVRGALRHLSEGLWLFTVPFPLDDCQYYVRWRPRAAALSPEAIAMSRLPERDAEMLLREFAGATTTLGPMRLSLVAAEADDDNCVRRRVVRASIQSDGSAAGSGRPQVNHRGDVSVVGQAWWGTPMYAVGQHSSPEMFDDEHALVALPVRFTSQAVAPAPWAVLRLGVLSPESPLARRLRQDRGGWRVLEPGVLAMVRRFSQFLTAAKQE